VNLEDIVLAAVTFTRTLFIPPARGMETWVHNTACICFLAAGVARYFFGV
jgi:hypothetical protein